MIVVTYAAAVIAAVSSLMVVTRRNAMHALLYLVVMMLALGLIFFTLGAPFAAAFQVIIYAGAIMVLFVFAVMIINPSPEIEAREGQLLGASVWALPLLITAVLFALTAYALASATVAAVGPGYVGPKQVGLAIFRVYLLGVELASLLLVAALVAAFHLAPPARRDRAEASTLPGTSKEAAHVSGS